MTAVRQALKQMPNGESKLVILYDLDSASLKNLDLTFAKELINRLDRDFPGALERVLVFNGHWSMNYAWSAISMLLHAETAEKVLFCNSSYRAQLLEYINEDHPYLKRLDNSPEVHTSSWFDYL